MTGGGGGGTYGGAVSIRPILSPRNSVNQNAPSGPAVRSDGSLAAVGTGKWFVTTPAVVILPIASAPSPTR